jgi:5-methylcytosine-specific restriction endonuclease McrA
VEIMLPSVIVLKSYCGPKSGSMPALTRRNLFIRDRFECQYCGGRFNPSSLTYDHVHPRKLGGKTTWLNTVTACGPCNNRKGSRLLKEIHDMKLRSTPRVPKWAELQAGSRQFPPKRMHKSWHDFFY